MARTVLHLSPHPDDELIGAPATLMSLRDEGWRVINVACGFGRPAQHARREGEAIEAARRARFELQLLSPQLSGAYDRDEQLLLARSIEALVREQKPEILVSPNPHDRHRAHELVARAARDALVALAEDAPAWWMWSIWGVLPLPNIATAFDEERLNEIIGALEAYGGELERNDYRRLVHGRAEMDGSRAPELLFGFATDTASVDYAELLTEVQFADARWLLGVPRWIEPSEPLTAPLSVDVTAWLAGESIAAQVASEMAK
jgi:LmbE family N-acetylglucosaminyl deacetylase